MVIFAEGWGISVMFVTVAWLFVVFGAMIAWGGHESDLHKIDSELYQLSSLWLLLSAMSVYLLSRYRDGAVSRKTDAAIGPVSSTPDAIDTFMFVRMSYWTYILLAFALYTFVRSFFT